MTPFEWVNTTLGNIKNAITGTSCKLGPDHAERYLASFAWRYNRRHQLQTTIPRFIHSATRTELLPFRALIARRLSGKSRKFLIHLGNKGTWKRAEICAVHNSASASEPKFCRYDGKC